MAVFCANCNVYGWSQPSAESSLPRCSRCKYTRYCSKECQQEHWVKVHKNHCRYLAKQKEMSKSRHDPATCAGCMKQAEIGWTEISKADNPHLGCPWVLDKVPYLPKPGDLLDTAVPLPFQLGEMTGQFKTKAEHTVSIMTRLLHKLKVTRHPAYLINPVASNHMVELLNEMRQNIWLVYIHQVPNSLDNAVAKSLKSTVYKLMDQVYNIDKELSGDRFLDQTVFRPWETFRLVLNILMRYSLHYRILENVVRLGLSGLCEDDQQLIFTPDQFNDMWRKVLASMDGILVLYTDLMKLLCGGDLNQKCFGCSQDIVVLYVGYYNCEEPFLRLRFTPTYLCGDEKCYNKALNSDNHITLTCIKIVCAAVVNTCDYCFHVTSGKVHRCTRCLTKYYCGKECRDEDWGEVHKLVCKEGQEKKVKAGQHARKQKGVDKVEQFVKFLEES